MKASTSWGLGEFWWWQPKRYRIRIKDTGSTLIIFSSKLNPKKIAKDFFGNCGFPVALKNDNLIFIRVRFSEKPQDFQDFPIVRINEKRSALVLKPKSAWVFGWAATIHLESRWLKSQFPKSFKAD